MTSSESKEPMDSEHSSSELRCKCGARRTDHADGTGACYSNTCMCAEFRCDHSACGWKPREEPEEEAHVYVSPAHCKACMRAWIGPDAVLEDESPLTPEEEEQAPEDEALAQFEQDVLDGKAGGPLPPQPERRPPYAVAYSVQGHLFEVALSGDASVRAVDGALVIQHHLGPVAGIVSVLPVINKESNA